MHGAKGWARDRKNRVKVPRKASSVSTPALLEALEEVEADADRVLDRKTLRREALTEKRQCRREHRAERQAFKQAVQLQRQTREQRRHLKPEAVPEPPLAAAIVPMVVTSALPSLPVTVADAGLPQARIEASQHHEWEDCEVEPPLPDVGAFRRWTSWLW